MANNINNLDNSRQVIVTGATGFLGRHIVPFLLQNKYDVVAIARDAEKAKTLPWFSDVNFIALDIHRQPDILVPEKNAALIHLAWPGLPDYKADFHVEDNFPASFAFIKAMIDKGVRKVLVSGTCFEYGLQEGALHANSPAQPVTSYGIAKDLLRRSLERLADEKDFCLQWARIFYMYGEAQNSRSLLAQLDAAIERGDSAFNMSGGEQVRDYLPVERAAEKLVDILKSHRSGIFNVCSGRPVTVRALVDSRIKERGSFIIPNTGYYPYADYEPMAFWGAEE
jgi:dTDP-6-deoxy-L-talose 4-dehydrogenase (NAD+)